MENYSPNRKTPSRDFYVNELKKSNSNLTKKDTQLDFFESKLQKLLDINYNFFRPFFEDEEYESNNNYHKADSNFDKTIENHLLKPKTSIITLFSSIWNKIVDSKIVNNIVSKKKHNHYKKLLS